MQTQSSPRKGEQARAEDSSPQPIVIRKLDRLETTHSSTTNGG